ncbi:putative reverse transcriptase domain-containing protein [Tanacetum coccineum]
MEKIFSRRHLGLGMDVLNYGYAFWINQCTSSFHGLDGTWVEIMKLFFILSKEDHEVHSKLVLELLKKEKLFAKFSKYEFWLQEVRFLRHMVNSNDIHRSDSSKIEAMEELLKKYLDAIRRNQKPEDFVVYCDTSNQGLGCVLMQRGKIKLFSDYECEIRYHPVKANVVDDALSRKERVKPKRVRAMGYYGTSSGVKRMILTAQSEAFKEENVPTKRLHGLDQQKALGMRLDMSTAYHPQTDGQSERTIQTLEDYVSSVLSEFSYNNSYHSSIRCAPFEALYGRKCRSPVLWAEIRESRLIGPELVQETTDKVVLIKEKLKAARDCQKSYADNRRKPLGFEVGDKVILEVSF